MLFAKHECLFSGETLKKRNKNICFKKSVSFILNKILALKFLSLSLKFYEISGIILRNLGGTNQVIVSFYREQKPGYLAKLKARKEGDF